MAEDRDVQSPSRAPVMRSTNEKQQRVSRPSKPDRPPRRLSSTKKTAAQHSIASPDPQDPKNAPIVAPLQFQSTINPSNLDQGASQPCARLRQLTAVDGGAALQRLYSIIQRQRDEWYQSNYTSTSPPTPMATPASNMLQNEQTPLNVTQLDNYEGRTFVTPGVVLGGTAGLVSTGYIEPSRVITPVTGSGASALGRGSMKSDHVQATKTSEVTPVSFMESQLVRFQTPMTSCEPLSLRPSGLVVSGDNLLSQELPGGAPYSTSFQQSGQNISGGTLESSTTQRHGKDISGGTLQSSSFQRLRQDTSGGTQQIDSFQRPERVMTMETEQRNSLQQLGQDEKGWTQKSNNQQQLEPEKTASGTQPESLGQSRIVMSGVAAQRPPGTFCSSALPQSDIQKSAISALPQEFQKSGFEAPGRSCESLTQRSLQRMDLQKSGVVSQAPSLQQSATQPGNQMPLNRPSSGPSDLQASVGPRPETYRCDMKGIPMPGRSSIPEWSQQSTGVTSMQASLGSSQYLESPESPGTSGMQMSKEPSHQSPSSLYPAQSGNQIPEGDSPKYTDIPEGQHQYPPEFSPQVSQRQTKSDFVSEELRGHMPASHMRRETAETKFLPRRRTIATANDPQTFESQVSAEFQILKELASSLKNIRYLPPPVAPTLGPAFENCVLSEIRSIRSRCTSYSQSGIYNQPILSVQRNGGGAATGPQNISQALEAENLSQGQELCKSSQVSAFEQQVITTLRSMSRSCKGGKYRSVDQRPSSAVKDASPGPSQSYRTRAFEELVLSKLNELEIEFECQQATQPVVSPAVADAQSQPNPEAVLPTTDPTSGTSGARASQAGVTSSADQSQQGSNEPGQQSPQSNTAQKYRFSSESEVGANGQPIEPSYIKASSKGTTPVNRMIGSLTFDTTTSTPARINRSEQSGPVQNQVEQVKEITSVEDKLRRDKFEADCLQQSKATDARTTQTQCQADRLSKPPNVSWKENDISFQRILEAPRNNAQMQETIYLQPTVAAQQIPSHGLVDRCDETTDEYETGSVEDSDSDLESVDSCSAQSPAFVHLRCDTLRGPDIKRQLNQTFLECDYAYSASELAPLADRRPRLSMPAKPSDRKIVGQDPANAPAELTQYTMSETQPSKIPLVPGSQSTSEKVSSYNRTKSSTAKLPLSSTLKEGHVQPLRPALPPDQPSAIESAPRRSSLTQENLSVGEYEYATQVSKVGSLEQRPLPLETEEAPESTFDCSGIYYHAASKAPVGGSRRRRASAFPDVCDPVDQGAEDSFCWMDDEPNASLRSKFIAADRYESECMAESGFQRRPCPTTSVERKGQSRGTFEKACSTPWPNRARPSGALHAFDSSSERPSGGPRKTTAAADCFSRCSNKRGRQSYGRTFSRPQQMHAAGTDPRCGRKNTEPIRTKVTNRMMKCMGVAPARSRYTHEPCTSSESESDCEF